MRVGWLVDQVATVGGAELTQAEFRAAAPGDVEIVDCPPGEVSPGCDVWVIHNCVTYRPEDLAQIDGRAVKYWHDVGPHVHPGVRQWLDKRAEHVCCSPLQAERMGLDAALTPPPVNLDRFRQAARDAQDRAGAVSVAAWMNPAKAPHLAGEWAAGNGGIDFYGGGPYAPSGSTPVSYDDMPGLLARYRTFVFLPTAVEPFGRLVAEAHAAGCDIVTNRLVGARYWLEQEPEKIETAADDFWALVTS